MARNVSHSWHFLILLALPMLPLPALGQSTLTGAMLFSTTSTGAWNDYAELNTVGGDGWWDLWLALNPDATSPVNGPTDAEAGISIPLETGHTYKYYFFGSGPCCTSSESYTALNLFFNGGTTTPGISVAGALNSPAFTPDSNTTITLAAVPVAGSGTSFSIANGVVVVLTGYQANEPAAVPGDVAQPFDFSPGDSLSFYGSFSLQVWPAAALDLSQASGAPYTTFSATGTGFSRGEPVDLFAGQTSTPSLIATATAGSAGSFSVSAVVPQHPYGPVDIYAVGATSHKLGAASLFVDPGLHTSPGTAAPGGTTTASVFGFGGGETVDIYWNNPRQLLGTAIANAKGSSSLGITVPSSASPGIQGVIGIGQTTAAIGIGSVTVE
jgi:hypothetical protein